MKTNFRCHCNICNLDVPDNQFKKHLKSKHNFSDIEAFIEQELHTNSCFKGIIPKDILKPILIRINQTNRNRIHKDAILMFYKSITRYREFKNEDIDLFFDKFLPWKLTHKCQPNNREQCDIIFYDNKEFADRLYKETMLIKNPYYNHKGKFSPYSDNFVGYKNLDKDEIERRKYIARHEEIRLSPVNVDYWIRKGYTEKQAKELVHKRQQTFSLEKCIEKYGLENGYKIWKERQEKWQSTLRSKPVEEQERINHNKVYKNGPKSGIESEFLNKLSTDISKHNKYIQSLGVIVDFIQDNKIIEFYGDYWHCNPKQKRFVESFYHPYLKMTAKEKWEFDENRINKLKNSGYEVKIVWESDYKEDKDSIINDCKKFLGE